MTTFRQALVFMCFSVCCFSISLSQSALADEFVIGVEDIEYYPIYAKRDGDYAGFARELFDAFGAESGHRFQYKPLPIKRLFSDFLGNKLDFKFPDNPNWQSDMKAGKTVIYSDAVLDYVDGVLVPPSRLGKGKAELKNLGVVRGFTAWDYLGDIDKGDIRVNEGNSLTSLVKMTESQRIDGVYFNVIVARYFLEHTEFKKNALVFDQSLPHTRGQYHLSTLSHPKIVEQFNQFLKDKVALVETMKAKYDVKMF